MTRDFAGHDRENDEQEQALIDALLNVRVDGAAVTAGIAPETVRSGGSSPLYRACYRDLAPRFPGRRGTSLATGQQPGKVSHCRFVWS